MSSHPGSTDDERPLAAIILAAGKGTRMNSPRPKVAHAVAGRPMVSWVVEAVRQAGAAPIILVIGHGADEIRDAFAGDDADLLFVEQAEQLGTGHATACAEAALDGFDGDVLVLAGDGPLIRAATIHTLVERQRQSAAAATLATAVLDDPTGYGRIVRDADGRFDSIVEDRDASPEVRAIHEIYPSYACFDAVQLFETLGGLRPNDASGEYHVTDVPAMLRSAGKRVEVVEAVPPEDVLSINTPAQLAQVEAILHARLATAATEDPA
ncbi:MAG: NTP transferase domain-containing protein [Planctomycetota bacterium]|jgi:bifunctional UDP-N-acetylglucosamine pyrophosphorylase/glucosamine-1-phosphate N-acetyltransferase